MNVVKYDTLECPRCGVDLSASNGTLDFSQPNRRAQERELRANFACPGCERPLTAVVKPEIGTADFAFRLRIVRPQF